MTSLPDFKQKQILFIQAEWGIKSAIKFCNDNIVFAKEGKITNRASCHKVFIVFILGDIAITTPLIRQAIKYGISFFLMNYNFETYAVFPAKAEGNYLLRMKQYNLSEELELFISKNLLKTKTENQLRLLNSAIKLKKLKTEKQKILKKIDAAEDNQSLLGIEGSLSKIFFARYFKELDWHKRMPRVKNDICNFLLDMGYTFLFNFVDSILRLYGFDNYKGIYHKLFFQRKSLSCDLVEPFRCIIEKQILKSFRLKQTNKKDFQLVKGRYELRFDKRQKYAQIFMESIMNQKEDIFLFIRGFYKFIVDSEKNKFPIFKIKIK